MPSAVNKKVQWLLPLSFLGVTAAGVALCAFAFRQGPMRKASATPTAVSVALASSPASPPAGIPSAPASIWPPEEIFRRAFWRQPTAQDRILHAERRESTVASSASADASAPSVARWQWFLALHPGPDLLRALRDPDTFGLVATATPHPWSDPAPDPLPAWFPSAAPPAEFEILQAPAGRLTLLYRAKDNTLFATDTGAGFAAAAKP